MIKDIIFEPLKFRHLTVKNRIFRSNTYGNLDSPDGFGTPARLKWEEKFARGGVGAILSGAVPVHSQGRIAPNCASLESDETIPFWRQVSATVRPYDCKYIVQLSYGGKQLAGASRELTPAQLQEIASYFAAAARRAREAGLDGIEVDATPSGTGRLLDDLTEENAADPPNLIAKFLSPRTNNRTDDYGGSWHNQARFLLETLGAIRLEVGADFHLQVKIGAIDNLADEIQLCQWVEAAGADALHVGRKIPYLDNPATEFPLDIAGAHVDNAKQLKQSVTIPILCTGGFQTASYIRQVLTQGCCDAVTLARALIANNDLVHQFAQGKDSPDKPCSYCEKCRLNLAENPLGCYDVSRYDGDYIKMSQEIMSVYL